MKTIRFQLWPPNLRGTAVHLSERGDFPRRAEGVEAIEEHLRQAVVKTFNRVFGRRSLHGDEVGDGVLHCAVLWRGVCCTFHQPWAGPDTNFEADTELDAASRLGAVSVTFHLTPGDRPPNTVDPSVLNDHIQRVEQAVSSHEKGDTLELLAAYLFSGVPGFRVLERNRATATEEIDLVIENGPDSPFHRDGQYVLVECKNWSGHCGKDDIVLLRDRMENRRGRCSLGFLISWNGFAQTVDRDALRHSRREMAIGLLSGDQIRQIAKVGQEAVLRRAVFEEVFR